MTLYARNDLQFIAIPSGKRRLRRSSQPTRPSRRDRNKLQVIAGVKSHAFSPYVIKLGHVLTGKAPAGTSGLRDSLATAFRAFFLPAVVNSVTRAVRAPFTLRTFPDEQLLRLHRRPTMVIQLLFSAAV